MISKLLSRLRIAPALLLAIATFTGSSALAGPPGKDFGEGVQIVPPTQGYGAPIYIARFDTAGPHIVPPTQGYTEAVYIVHADTAGLTFTFNIEKARGAGVLTVDTRDCCIPGDIWLVEIDPNQPAAPKKDATGVGDGSIDMYSGGAVAMPFVRGSVTVSYDSGTDIFPADMWIRFVYSKSTGVHIVAPVGAQLIGSAP